MEPPLRLLVRLVELLLLLYLWPLLIPLALWNFIEKRFAPLIGVASGLLQVGCQLSRGGLSSSARMIELGCTCISRCALDWEDLLREHPSRA